jgi:hypothetical protein
MSDDVESVENPAALSPTSAGSGSEGTHLTSDVPGLCEVFKMVWYPKVIEDLCPTHKFVVLHGGAYCLAGLIFMASPWLGSIIFTFGQLATDACPEETGSFAEDEGVCSLKWAGGKVANDVLSDDGEGASCMCDQERSMLQFAAFFVFLVGYLYIQMARGNSLHFIAAATFNRTVLVPVRCPSTGHRKFPHSQSESSPFRMSFRTICHRADPAWIRPGDVLHRVAAGGSGSHLLAVRSARPLSRSTHRPLAERIEAHSRLLSAHGRVIPRGVLHDAGIAHSGGGAGVLQAPRHLSGERDG